MPTLPDEDSKVQWALALPAGQPAMPAHFKKAPAAAFVTMATWLDHLDRTQTCYVRRERRQPSDLLVWGRTYLAEHFRLPPSRMHLWLGRQLDDIGGQRGAKLNVIGPRGGAKSTVVTLANLLRTAVEGWEPYIWIVSDTIPQARAHLDNLKRELLANERLAADYPSSVGKGRMWRVAGIELRNGVRIEALGAGQHIRGRRVYVHRPTLIICDDLQNDSHIRSAPLRRRSAEWFNGALLKAGTKYTNVVNVATALHADALAVQLSRTPGWTSQTFRAICRWPDNMTLWEAWEATYRDVDRPQSKQLAREYYERHRAALEQGAELLWPEEEDLYTLMCMRAEQGRTTFEREKQGSPINPEMCEWPEEYFSDRIWFDAWPTRWQVKTLALDPSKGADAHRGDYSALVALAVDLDGVLFVEADLARRPTPQIVADGVELYRRFQPDALGVEANQFQELLCDEFAAEFRRQGLLDARPWTLQNRVSKPVRIRRLSPYLASGRLRFKRDSPSTILLVEQLRQFPIAEHDDGPDALEMAIRLAGELMAAADDDGLGERLPVGD